MARPCSMDFRERVVLTVERDGLSRNEAAQRFGIAISTAANWLRRHRETGSVVSEQMGEKAIAAVVAASPDLAARDALLRTTPGVGPVVAACLLARMPELGRIASRQFTALAGLAPFDRQSGKTGRPGRCSGGRPAVRRCLYLAALTIARSGKGPLAATASRLRAAGKSFKLAIVATMRKLLITLNAMAKNNTEYCSA